MMDGMCYTYNDESKTKLSFPKEFFRGEFRCGFFVSTNMKHYWAAQLEMLAEIDRICRKYDITWFADSGTLLGAVRHKGFIPWDDDVDIAMMRSDYDRFSQVCLNELDEKYMFVKSFNNKLFDQCFSRVCENMELKGSKYSLDYYFDSKFFSGVDIFPLDYIAPSAEEEQVQIELTAIINEVTQRIMKGAELSDVEEWLSSIEDLAGLDIDRSGDIAVQMGILFDRICCLYSEEEAKEVTLFPYIKNVPTWRYKKEWYKETVLLEFECLKLPCPVGYQYILSAGYGDYMKYERGGSLHDYPIYSGYKNSGKNEWGQKMKKSLKKDLRSFFKIDEDRVEVLDMLKYGFRNATMLFKLGENEYTIRIPVSKTKDITTYKNEKRIYNLLKSHEIADNCLYFNEDNGNKISQMILNGHPLDVGNKEEVLECFEVVTYVHQISTSSRVTFDIWDYIERYEELWGDLSFYDDYQDTKKKVRKCYEYALSQPHAVGITHFDLSGENFVITDVFCDEKDIQEKDIRIIDWEYAGIQDTHIDLAVFILNAGYSRDEADWLIDSYFGGDCPENIRLKIYCYISVCALLFSNYYEYVDRNGEDMTQEQASYHWTALEYYELVSNLI